MDIGPEKEPYVVEPLVEPIPGAPSVPAPEPAPDPVHLPEPEREKVPA